MASKNAPSGGFLDWQYFAMFCDNGAKLAGALTRSDRDCDVWLAMYGPDNRKFSFQRYYPLDAFVSVSPDHVRIKDNFFLRRKNRLLTIIKEQDLELRLQAKSIIALEDLALQHEIQDRHADWAIPFLKMRCEGQLVIGDQSQEIGGYLFHDRVWHNFGVSLDLAYNLRSWIWGIMYSKTFSVLFVDIDHRKQPFRFLCVNDSKNTTYVSSSSKRSTNFNFVFEGNFPKSEVEIQYNGNVIKIHSLKNHYVEHGGLISRMISRIMKPKHHYVGKFTFMGEEGEAYLESCRYL